MQSAAAPSRAARPSSALGRRDHLTYRGNLGATRHGWLRLTPAYSVQLVGQLLDELAPSPDVRVLDPFCGTGTTALACAERGLPSATTDINPFLLWLARAKTRRYAERDLRRFAELARELEDAFVARRGETWLPPLHRIEKWWPDATLKALGRVSVALSALERREAPARVDLLKIAFCQTLIRHAAVSFGHQSMSFRRPNRAAAPERTSATLALVESFRAAVSRIAESARAPIGAVPNVVACDARELGGALDAEAYSLVITSPPYPNRMSYIRELRPYMYWLRYLSDGKGAGELDWQAIGGTWGAATSNLSRWTAPSDVAVPHRGFGALLRRIDERSPILSRYVHKYFCDMARHARALFEVVAPGGSVHYIVGNSKFYDVVLPVERIFASLFRAVGFERTRVRPIRKRTSKKELYEFVVSARKP